MKMPKFFSNLFLNISALPGKYVIAGDFNCTLDPAKDRPTGSNISHTQSRKAILHFMKELNLTDLEGTETR